MVFRECHEFFWSTLISNAIKKDTTNVPFGPRSPSNCFAMQLRCDALHLCWWLGPLRSPTSLVVYAHLFMLRIKKHPQGCFFVLVFHCHFPLRRTTTLWHSVPKWQFSPLRSPTPNAVALGWASLVVGVARLELAASWSRTKRATKLRYTPFSVLAD